MTAFSSHMPTASDPNSMKYPVTLVLPGEQHRGCYTTTAASHTTTLSVRSWCLRSASSLSSRSNDPKKHHGGTTDVRLLRCCTECTGCRLIKGSSTRWRWSHSKSSKQQRQPILADTYSPATVCGIHGHRTLRCCVNHSPNLTSPDVVSITQLLPSGTHYLEQYSKARR